MRDRFEALGRILDEDEEERRASSATRDPGERIAEGLAWSEALMPDYQRLLDGDPAFAAREEERALAKADLHRRWRELHSGDR